NFQPPCSGHFVARDQRSRTFRKDLSAAAGTAAHSRIMKLLDHPFEGLARDLHEEVELDHRKCFEVYRRESILQTAEEIEVVVEWQIRIQTTHNVKFGKRIGVFLLGEVKYFLEPHRVTAILPG